ncbi:MAG: amidohydrolase family protein, partial [Saprospiraceae bacterium]
MVYKITANHVLSSDGSWSDDTIIITDQSGLILGLDHKTSHDPASVRKLSGVLVPGLINTHCHLELSHMKNKVDTGTGLLPFLNRVVSYRDIDQDIIDQAIVDGDAEMRKNGIVAVGDISNKADTAHVKSSSQIDYYTFVEMFDFMQPSMTNSTIKQYEPVMHAQSEAGHNKKSYVPHAPYTVSPDLFKYVNDNNKKGSTISIHNQETPDEDQLFMDGSGGFFDFFNGFGMNMDHFRPLGKSSLHFTIQHLKPDFNTIFVHNTLTTAADIL